MTRKRLQTAEQLAKKYAESLASTRCEDYFDFIVYCFGMSSSPEETFKCWYLEMTKKDRKAFCLFLLRNVDNVKEILSLAIKYL